MLTYQTLDQMVLDLSDLTDEERAYFDRCYQAYRDRMPWEKFIALMNSNENPVIRANGGVITRAGWSTALYQAVSDLSDRLGIQQGRIGPNDGDDLESDPIADEWLSPAEAAARKGVHYSGVNQAIKRGDLIARPAKPGGKHVVVSFRSLQRWQPVAARQSAGRSRKSVAR